MKKYLTLILIIYSTGIGAQDWSYTPFATSTPYPIKMKILKIGTVDMSLPENECPAKNWSFYAGDCNCSLFSYNAVKYNKGIMVTWVVGGWTMQELKAIEDSANGITYSFQIETWYDTVKPKLKTFYNSDGKLEKVKSNKKVNYSTVRIVDLNDTVKPKVTNDTIYTPVPLYYEVKKGRTIFSMKKIKNSKLYKKPTVFYGIAGIKKQPIDSSKYFYRRFMAERKRGIPDSLNKFKSKLYKK